MSWQNLGNQVVWLLYEMKKSGCRKHPLKLSIPNSVKDKTSLYICLK